LIRDDAKWPHARWCDGCEQYHGPLYPCESYSPELKAEIAAASERYRRDLMDPEWCKTQVARGMPAEIIAVFRALVGIE
jgi:hypothetical protein